MTSCAGIVRTPDNFERLCNRHLEAAYAPALCPRCLADVVLKEAVTAAAAETLVGWIGWRTTSELYLTDALTTADAVLHEDPAVLARFAHT